MKIGCALFTRRRNLAVGMLCLILSGASGAQAYIASYGLSPASPAVDLGVQPLGYPSGVISAVMRHDRILQKVLADAGQPFKTPAFKRGADMLPLLANQSLDSGLLGDTPTLMAASAGHVWIAALAKQSSTAIVVRGETHLSGLAGKRIGYVEASSAHYTLLQGLALAHLGESQVTLVSMGVDDMPGALERGEVDAFVAWEPAPSVALGMSEKNRIVFRGQSTDYLVIERAFERRSPQTARHLVAGFVRAIEWMRRSQHHVEKAAQWAMAEGQAFSGKPATLPVAQIVAITRREILNVPSAPAILLNPDAPPLKNEFRFLSKLGKLPAQGTWDNVEAAFAYDGLTRVLAQARAFQITTFDYED